MERFGLLYDVPKERQYTDYKELIAKEQPDIVSVATQPEHRAEVVIHAVDNGARAIYAEKAMAASMREAADMVEAVERNGAFFNLGTNRRWSPGYDAMRDVDRLRAPRRTEGDHHLPEHLAVQRNRATTSTSPSGSTATTP